MRTDQYLPAPTLIADVKGSEGGLYRVMVNQGNNLTCQCTGWQYRKDCRHTEMVRELIELHKEVKIVSAGTPVGVSS